MSEIKTLKVPTESISVVIIDKEYEIKWPNNAQYIEIESMKFRLTGDSYNSMVNAATGSADLARYTVDMIAFLSICCPKLKEDLKVGTFSELSMLHTKQILNVYLKSILPWITDWHLILNAPDEEIKTEESK